VHLVAPQLWAWAPWRAAKLRRLTSQVLCVLPFEEAWFRERSIPARFIGHPAINRSVDHHALATAAATLPDGNPRVLLLPGSREHEVRANLPFLLDVFGRLAGDHPGIRGVVVVARSALLPLIQAIAPDLPATVSVVDAPPDVAMTWADLALAVSGTVSLDLTRHGCPMVGVYRTGRFGMALARTFITIPDLFLPNIVAGRRITPEFIPWTGDPASVAEAAQPLLQPEAAARQRADLEAVTASFGEHEYADEAARAILEFARLGGRA